METQLVSLQPEGVYFHVVLSYVQLGFEYVL